MRPLAIVTILLVLPLSQVLAQGAPSFSPSITMTPSAGTSTTGHEARAEGLPANVPVRTALFDPAGEATTNTDTTTPGGTLVAPLQPPANGWQVGLYRWVLALADGRSFSATFASGDGHPHLYAQPDLPSPNSAFNFVGIGFAPGAHLSLLLMLTGAQGQRNIDVTTDNDGTFSIFVWPGQLGLPFYAAGNYRILIPATDMTVDFMVREHPVSASVSLPEIVESQGLANLHLENYAANKYVWLLYADETGKEIGEILLGPTSIQGDLTQAIAFPPMAPGTYFLASPYDWGETSFAVPQPPATAPTTPSPTVGTQVTTPVSTPAERPLLSNARCRHCRKDRG